MSLPSCDVFSSEELWFVCLVFDYCNQGTLRTILKRHDLKRKKKQQHRDHPHMSTTTNGILNLQRIMTWMHQILSALQYMHQNHVIHRDVKPDNCFLNRGKIQLGDMGFARRLMSDSAFASSVLGTQGYIAPELRNENPKYDFKVDIFGAGCTLLELLLWKRIDFAYQILNNPAAIFQSVRENFEAEDQKLLLLAETMARSMLVANPDDRPDASSLLQAFYEVSARSQISFHVSNDSMDQDEIKQNRRSVFSDYQMKRLKLRQMMMVMDSDIYRHIFFYLSISNILKNRAVCRLWNSIISEPRTCRQLCEKMSMDDYEIESIVRGNKSGINAFVQSYRVRTNWSVGRYSYAQFNIQGAPNICCVYGKTGDQMVRHLKNIYEQTRIHNRRTENTTRSVTNDSFVESSDHAVLLTGSRSGSLHLHDVYNLNTGKDIELRTIRTFNGHSDAVLCSVFDPEKLSRIVVSAGADKCVMFWDMLSGRQLHVISNVYSRAIWDMLVMDSTLLVAGEDPSIQTYNITSRSFAARFQHGLEGYIYAIAEDKHQLFDKCIMVGSSKGSLALIDTRAKESIFQYDASSKAVFELGWNGYELVTGHISGIINIFDIRRSSDRTSGISHSHVQTINLSSQGSIRGMRIHRDMIVSGTLLGSVVVSDRATGQFINSLEPHNKYAIEPSSGLMTSLDMTSNLLVTANNSGLVGIYDFST